MREIKFRGKTLSGKWVYGDLVHFTNTEGVDASVIITGHQATTESDDFDYALCYARNEFKIVIPESVGQFTGLHDKNGKEIYEGDIVDFISPFFRDLTYPSYPAAPVAPRHYYQCVVVWNERDCGFGLVSPKEALLNPCERQPVGITQISDSCLIGNIHDNPELLKTE